MGLGTGGRGHDYGERWYSAAMYAEKTARNEIPTSGPTVRFVTVRHASIDDSRAMSPPISSAPRTVGWNSRGIKTPPCGAKLREFPHAGLDVVAHNVGGAVGTAAFEIAVIRRELTVQHLDDIHRLGTQR